MIEDKANDVVVRAAQAVKEAVANYPPHVKDPVGALSHVIAQAAIDATKETSMSNSCAYCGQASIGVKAGRPICPDCSYEGYGDVEEDVVAPAANGHGQIANVHGESAIGHGQLTTSGGYLDVDRLLRYCGITEPSMTVDLSPLMAALDFADMNICEHEDTKRGGFLWTICSSCGKTWADDEGGFQPSKWPELRAAAWARIRQLEDDLKS